MEPKLESGYPLTLSQSLSMGTGSKSFPIIFRKIIIRGNESRRNHLSRMMITLPTASSIGSITIYLDWGSDVFDRSIPFIRFCRPIQREATKFSLMQQQNYG
jgi:hypothetical protein